MGLIQDFRKKEDKVRQLSIEEQRLTSIDNVIKPSIIEEIMAFDYSFLDTLQPSKLVAYMGALSQYLIWLNKHINQLQIISDCAENAFKSALNIATLAVDHKQFTTAEERKTEAQRNTELSDLKNVMDSYKEKVAMHKDETDFINNLIQTFKKVYDAKIKERFMETP